MHWTWVVAVAGIPVLIAQVMVQSRIPRKRRLLAARPPMDHVMFCARTGLHGDDLTLCVVTGDLVLEELAPVANGCVFDAVCVYIDLEQALGLPVPDEDGDWKREMECLINGVTHASGVVNPANPCQSCEPGTSAAPWSNRRAVRAPVMDWSAPWTRATPRANVATRCSWAA